MIHTTNLIDMKIGLQIASIEVYLIGFFFGVCSTLKGRIRSNVAMIHDQTHLNWIAIKSRMRGDHEELRILLKNCLILSRFNQELFYKEEEHRFIENFLTKIVDRLI